LRKISNGVASSIEKLTEPQVEAIQLTWGSVKKFNQKEITAKITTAFMHELTKHNIVCVQRKVKGKTMNYRVGIKIPEDEPDWFKKNYNSINC
jgi:hypothetical protein